jgi:hypothetical protein
MEIYSISITWTTNDLKPLFNQYGIVYIHTDAVNILNNIAHAHDANVGINNDVLDFAFCEYFNLEAGENRNFQN